MYDIYMDLGVARADIFNRVYPVLNEKILKTATIVSSRNGDTKEALNFKTIIEKPMYRCVGGHDRDINIFFLLAEAMWIWAGRSDVDFLTIFNSNMRQFSDNGKTFHAPYGFRIRHWGASSNNETPREDSNRHAPIGTDQLLDTLELMVEEPETRRAVMSIWNPALDLNVSSRDLPCNDLVFLQERQGKIHMTISNRSNDLHWGLPTNVFQFSWMLEMICLALGKEMGTQVHNSKSLHVYTENEIPLRMLNSNCKVDIYAYSCPMPIDFHFHKSLNVSGKLNWLDEEVDRIIWQLERLKKDGTSIDHKGKSKYFNKVVRFLAIYVEYTRTGRTDEDRWVAFDKICNLEVEDVGEMYDFILLGKSWFARRFTSEKAIAAVKENIIFGRL